MMIGDKSVTFEKMGWLDVEDNLDYLHYYPSDYYLFTDDDQEDLDYWEVVDYQRKE